MTDLQMTALRLADDPRCDFAIDKSTDGYSDHDDWCADVLIFLRTLAAPAYAPTELRQGEQPDDAAAGKCGCHKCTKDSPTYRQFMIVCPECGNKRCPKASDHELACTNSNDTGQHGSVYE